MAWILLTALSLGGAGCARKAVAPPQRPNVLVLLVDTLRRDHLGCYGYRRPTTPNIDRLAARGIKLEEAISSSSWTQPAVASLFTGLMPTVHGMVSDSTLRGSQARALSPKVITLAEAFDSAGYNTAAVSTNVFLNPVFGLDQGFDIYKSGPFDAGELAPGGVDLLRILTRESDRPFFAYVHFNDVHGPYRCPAPWNGRFHSTGGRALTDEEFDRLGYLRRTWTGPPGETPRTLEYYVDQYDDCISYTDAAIGYLMAGLDSLGLSDRTLVLLLADHGEEFLEHDGFDHGHTLFDEVIRIPMIVAWPGHLPRGRSVTGLVSLVDVMPTLLDLCGISIPGNLSGSSRADLWKGRRLAKERAYTYSELSIRGPYRLAERSRTGKWIYNEARRELTRHYDLAADPGETRNLIAQPAPAAPDVARRVAARLARMRRKAIDLRTEQRPVDKDVLDRLQGLGYVN